MSVALDKADLSLKYLAHYKDASDALNAGSPKLLNDARAEAFEDFLKAGIPTRKNENYKYTNLHPYFAPEFQFQHQASDSDSMDESRKRCDVPNLDTYQVTTTNGWFDKNSSVEIPKGVTFGSINQIAGENPELIEKYYGKQALSKEDPLVALNTALAMDGYCLFVPKNTVVDKPIQIINFLGAEQDTFVTQRNLIVIEPGAQVQLILCDHTINLNKYLGNVVTELYAGDNSNVDYYTLQNLHNNTALIHSVFIQQERDSVVTSHTSTLHGGLIRNNLKFTLNGENAEANMYGMSFIDRKQHVDNFTQIIHAKPHCESNQVYKNVLDDEASGAFSGRIHVVRDAQKTNAFQQNNNLLLTDSASMQTKPQLIIDADDVKCSHGATVGQIDEEALFYLRSRGIEESKARLMMMNAFAHEVVEQIKIESLRDRIDDLIDKRLRGEVARCHDCEYNCE